MPLVVQLFFLVGFIVCAWLFFWLVFSVLKFTVEHGFFFILFAVGCVFYWTFRDELAIMFL
tara:strand:+ start:663 stop:845 length:183 start_codon:yes stop_codon:yes gene_type:complete